MNPARFSPEGLNHLPAYFRGEVEAAKNHPIPWLLESFEANLHLAERMVEYSRMLLDPEEVELFVDKVRPPTLAMDDLVDAPALAAKLLSAGKRSERSQESKSQEHQDKVSDFLWRKFGEREREAVGRCAAPDGAPVADRQILLQALNQIILGPKLDELDRFSGVRFSPRTRRLRALKGNKFQSGECAKLNRLLLQDAYPREILALTETPALDPTSWRSDWLEWLASFLYLDLDQEWLSQPGEWKVSEAPTGGPDTLIPCSAAAAAAIRQAAVLYRRRGTPAGLADYLRQLHGWNLEIVERSWPRGMEIGETSTIGSDTWLTDALAPDLQFTVLIKHDQANSHRLGLGQIQIGDRLETTLAGAAHGRRIEVVLARTEPGPEPAPDIPSKPEPTDWMAVAVTKLRDVIDGEKPAHTRYYLALEAAGPLPAETARPPLVIELDSVIENFWLN